jgi:L-lactate dehydrogenase complex protein LldG
MKQQNDLVLTMTNKATAVGTIVHGVVSVVDAFQYAIDLNKKKRLKTMTCPGLVAGDRNIMSDLCKTANLDLLDDALRTQATAIDTSLTWADYGIAETGTIMLASDSEEMRIATMLARIHIALLPISKIRSDTAGIEKELNDILKRDTPSYTAFITGPSRTADIERVLAIGVHGPVEHHLLLIEEAKDHD